MRIVVYSLHRQLRQALCGIAAQEGLEAGEVEFLAEIADPERGGPPDVLVLDAVSDPSIARKVLDASAAANVPVAMLCASDALLLRGHRAVRWTLTSPFTGTALRKFFAEIVPKSRPTHTRMRVVDEAERTPTPVTTKKTR
jgi:hypothetical protein